MSKIFDATVNTDKLSSAVMEVEIILWDAEKEDLKHFPLGGEKLAFDWQNPLGQYLVIQVKGVRKQIFIPPKYNIHHRKMVWVTGIYPQGYLKIYEKYDLKI